MARRRRSGMPTRPRLLRRRFPTPPCARSRGLSMSINGSCTRLSTRRGRSFAWRSTIPQAPRCTCRSARERLCSALDAPSACGITSAPWSIGSTRACCAGTGPHGTSSCGGWRSPASWCPYPACGWVLSACAAPCAPKRAACSRTAAGCAGTTCSACSPAYSSSPGC